MKVKFLSTTSTPAKCMVGLVVDLSYSLTAHFTFDPSEKELGFDYRHGRWSTSIIKDIKIVEIQHLVYEISISTNNSVYVFLHGTPMNKKVLTDKEKMALQLMFI